jgi:hypothetical protein
MTAEEFAEMLEAGLQELRGKSPELAAAFLAMARKARQIASRC